MGQYFSKQTFKLNFADVGKARSVSNSKDLWGEKYLKLFFIFWEE